MNLLTAAVGVWSGSNTTFSDMEQERDGHEDAGEPLDRLVPAAPLSLRRAPVQARGRATFERILDTTAELLEEVGIERVTTNLIASRAGINIATLYKYFPNKLSVVNALFQHQLQQRADYTRAATPHGATSDWRRVIDIIVDTLSAARRRQPGNSALRRAMVSSPALRGIHDAVSREGAHELALRISAYGRVTGNAAETTARCALEILAALLDLAEGENEPMRTHVQQEAKKVLKGYLAHCFEP